MARAQDGVRLEAEWISANAAWLAFPCGCIGWRLDRGAESGGTKRTRARADCQCQCQCATPALHSSANLGRTSTIASTTTDRTRPDTLLDPT